MRKPNVSCIKCGHETYQRPNEIALRNGEPYHCKNCWLGRNGQRSVNAACGTCGKGVYRRPAEIESGPVYCSRACSGKAQRLHTRSCPQCSKEFVGRKIHCSVSCSNRARKGIVYDGTQKRNNLFKVPRLKLKLAEQRGGVCETCGWRNFAVLEVHHVIPRCDGGGDELENLKLLCQNCHGEQHHGSCTYEEFLLQQDM